MASMVKAIWRVGLLAFVLGCSVMLAKAPAAGPVPYVHHSAVETFTRTSVVLPAGVHLLTNLGASRHKTTGGDAYGHAVLTGVPLPTEICSLSFVRESDLHSGSTGRFGLPPTRSPPSC